MSDDEVVCSTLLTKERYAKLMFGAVPMNYAELKDIIRRRLPRLYERLCLAFYNPYGNQSKETKTHYILAHSMKEWFIKK
jgi:hypothetical protein